MKGLSQGYVWWPILDKDIESTIPNCEGCQGTANNPAHSSLHQWKYPALLWQRLYIDFTGPVQGKMLMVVIEARLRHAASGLRSLWWKTLLLRRLLAHCAPCLPTWDSLSIWCLTTDQSSLQKRLGNLQLLMVLSMLWVHPTNHATNGHVEKLVQSFKKGVTADQTGRTLQHKLDTVLHKKHLLQPSTAPSGLKCQDNVGSE